MKPCCLAVGLVFVVSVATVGAQDAAVLDIGPAVVRQATADVRLNVSPLPDAAADPSPQATTPPPEPMHTGFAALAHETWNDFKAFPRRESTWVILGVGGGAAPPGHPRRPGGTAPPPQATTPHRVWAPRKDTCRL